MMLYLYHKILEILSFLTGKNTITSCSKRAAEKKFYFDWDSIKEKDRKNRCWQMTTAFCNIESRKRKKILGKDLTEKTKKELDL